MRRLPRSAAVAILVPLAMLAACSTTAVQNAAAGTTKMQESVDLALMTWVELKAAIEAGKTTALVYNGGTETRGPQAVTGGHTLVVVTATRTSMLCCAARDMNLSSFAPMWISLPVELPLSSRTQNTSATRGATVK